MLRYVVKVVSGFRGCVKFRVNRLLLMWLNCKMLCVRVWDSASVRDGAFAAASSLEISWKFFMFGCVIWLLKFKMYVCVDGF